jgi:hypothetical protein
MSKSTASAGDYLRLVYNATAIALIADNTATTPLTNIFVAAHTADPGTAGDQTTSEVAYTGYARASVARTVGGWTVNVVPPVSVSPVANVSFGACTSGSAIITHWSTGKVVSGASPIFHRGVFGSRLGAFSAVVAGNAITIPQLAAQLAVNDRIAFYAIASNTSGLPGGVTEGVVYHVITVSTDVITVSLTSGGASITLTTAGDGIAFRVTPIVVSAGITPQLGTTGNPIVEE